LFSFKEGTALTAASAVVSVIMPENVITLKHNMTVKNALKKPFFARYKITPPIAILHTLIIAENSVFARTSCHFLLLPQ
jgi:hypothetical protein